jgi:hypothetical protein
VVTRTIIPPRPPGVRAAHPSAVGNAFMELVAAAALVDDGAPAAAPGDGG